MREGGAMLNNRREDFQIPPLGLGDRPRFFGSADAQREGELTHEACHDHEFSQAMPG
jgi:hypothetical protein